MSTQPYIPHYPEEIEDLKENAAKFRAQLAKDKELTKRFGPPKQPPVDLELTRPRNKPTIVFFRGKAIVVYLAMVSFLSLSGCYIERGDRRDSAASTPAIQISVSPDQMTRLREELLK